LLAAANEGGGISYMNAGPMHEMGHYVKFVENSLTAYMVRSAYKVEMSKEKHFCGTVILFCKKNQQNFPFSPK
jgi:hypothetical protein